MASTEIWGDHASVVKRWGNKLFKETLGELHFKQCMGKSKNSCVVMHTDLEAQAGDEIKYDFRPLNRSAPTLGDARLKGNETPLQFYQDSVKVDQMREGHEWKTMSQQATLHDLYDEAKESLTEYYGWQMNGLMFAYGAGVTGDDLENVGATIDRAGGASVGFAGNALTAPDSDHILSPSSVAKLEHLDTLAEMCLTLNPRIRPAATMDGEKWWTLFMHPYSLWELRNEAGDTKWTGIYQRAVNMGKKNPIFTGAEGCYGGIIIRRSEYIPRSTTATEKTHNLLMGAGAMSIAFANGYKKHKRRKVGGGTYFSFVEDDDDFGNSTGIAGGSVFGIKRNTFNGNSFGVIRYDTRCDKHS